MQRAYEASEDIDEDPAFGTRHVTEALQLTVAREFGFQVWVSACCSKEHTRTHICCFFFLCVEILQNQRLLEKKIVLLNTIIDRHTAL